MKHFSRQISWLLAYVLIITSIVSTSIPAYASENDTITLSTDTNQVIVAGTKLAFYSYGSVRINYYESADSNTVLYEDTYAEKIGSDEIAVKPYAWHVSFEKEVQGDNSHTMNPSTFYFKAYPDTSLENVPVNTVMTLPEGTQMTLSAGTPIAASGSAISIYVGDTKLTDYYEESSSFTLPSASELRSDVGELMFDDTLDLAGYKLPDLTKLFYTVELTEKSATSLSLKLNLVPTVDVTFNEYPGTPNLYDIQMYATPKAAIDSTKLPQVSVDDIDLYGWKINGSTDYVYKTDGSPVKGSVNNACELKAMYKEPNPTFKLDIVNQKIINLLPGRTYEYPKYSWSTYYISQADANDNGEIEYRDLSKLNGQFRLSSRDNSCFVNSDFVSLKHNTPNKPVIKSTATTAMVTNTNDFVGCEFAIRARNDYSDLSWGTSSTFSGLKPDTQYKIYVRHIADENGFESDEAESVAFTTSAALEWLVSFDGNGGTGKMDNVSVLDGEQYTLPACTFTPTTGKTFKAWKIGENEYAPGNNYTVTADTTVTAVWMDIEKVKTPTISPNGGTFNGSQTVTIACETADAKIYYTTDGTAPTTESTLYSKPFTIRSSSTVKAIAVKDDMAYSDIASASFTKRSSNSGGSTTPTSTPTPTPTPSPSYTVIFNTDGGSTIDTKSIKEGSTIGELPAPTKKDYVFEGWYSDKELTKAYDADTKITASTTLYAKWTKVEPKPTDNTKNELILTIGQKEATAFGSTKTNDVAPIIQNGKPMLPARFVAESLGAKVTWNGKKRLVTIKGKNEKGKNVTILFYIGSKYATVNGKKVKLESPAFQKNRRVYTPLKFIAENLGASVTWNKATKQVVITKK